MTDPTTPGPAHPPERPGRGSRPARGGRRRTPDYVCRACGATTVGWAGRCPACNEWATVEPVVAGGGAPAPVRSLASVAADPVFPAPSGVDEVDRVLGGGLVPGAVVLLGGEPGIGKSTLTLQLGLAVGATGAGVLVVAGEEAPAQIAARAARIGPIPPTLTVIDSVALAEISGAIPAERPQLAIVDSIQMVRHGELDGPAGSVAQVKAATEALAEVAQRTGATVILVGHLTKDGSLAGPKAVEHLVDTVLLFEGERSGELRFLRCAKHRHGPTTELGLFEMTGLGLQAVTDPSRRFLGDRCCDMSGSVVVPTLDGARPLLVELQALAVAAPPPAGGITAQGLDRSRLTMIAAVLTRRAGRSLAQHELFLSATAGVTVTEPGADLALAVAIDSALTDVAVPPDLVVCGELGLGGEVRSVARLEPRLHEAYRLGFRTAVVPLSAPDGPTGLRVIRCGTVVEALDAARRAAR
ncbi:MAG: DNA repair protein RadA [Acidimicrobiales bacterium]